MEEEDDDDEWRPQQFYLIYLLYNYNSVFVRPSDDGSDDGSAF